MMIQNQPVEKVEVVYTKAKVSKRMLGYFIDLGLFLLTTFILYSIINIGITRAPFFVAKQDELIKMKNDSGLYINNVDFITYVNTDESFTTTAEKNVELKTRIDNFYSNPTYIDDIDKILTEYKARREKKYVTDAQTQTKKQYFIENGGGNYSINSEIDPELIFHFFEDEAQTYSLAYLTKNPRYFELTRFSFWTSIIEFLIIGTISFILYFLIFPLLIFPRGRQTLGMKLEKIGLITINAENQSGGIYSLRFIFMYFVMLLINLASFLIPSFVSIAMMFISKTNSSLVNYIFNDYCVDVTNQKIYFNDLEREEASIKLQQMSIENKNLILK